MLGLAEEILEEEDEEDSIRRGCAGSINSDSDDAAVCESPFPSNAGSGSLRPLGKRKTLGSSSGSDVALHEGNDLSDDDQQPGRRPGTGEAQNCREFNPL